MTFIDWGYKAYDATRGFVKNIFGEGGVKQFDNLMSTLNTLSNVIILASLASAMPGGGDLVKSGKNFIQDRLLQRGAQQAGQAAATQAGGSAAGAAGSGGAAATQAGGTATQAGGIGAGAIAGIVAGAGLLASALGEGAFQLRKIATKPLQDKKREFDKLNWWNPRKYFVGAQLAGMNMLLGPLSALGVLLDIIGAPFRYAIELLRFPFLSEEDKKKQAYNLSKFDARIREDFRKALNMLTLGFAFKEKGSFGNIYGNQGAQNEMMGKMAGGGKPTTRGGRLVSGPARRTLKKKKKTRTLSFTPRKIKPGASVGGEEKVRSVFPNPEKAWWDPFGLFAGKQPEEKPEKPKGKQTNPQEFLVDSNDTLGRSNFFGPFFTLAIKSVLGQKPDQLDYKNAGKGLNSWVNTTFKSGTFGFAGGGEVDASEFFSGEDYTNVIAKSVEDSVSKEVETTIRNLSKELSLRPVGREEMIQKNISPDEGVDQKPDPNLDVGPGGTVTGGNADFWTLVAISRMEDSDPQGSADVAQSIYNRVSSGIYGGKTIKEIVLRQGQYEPTWKYPRRGKTGVPNPEWYSIKDLASASIATGISQSDLQRTAAALRNSKYQEEARKFIGGRTDFMGGSNKPGPGDIRRRGNEPNNFFGWFVGPAAKAYGAKNPGPAKAPQLGDIVVMGGGGAAGAPMVSVKGGKAFPLPKGRIGTGSGQVYGAPRSYGGHAGVDLVEANWKPGTDPKIPVVSYAGGKVVSSSPRYSHQTSGYTSNLTIDHGPFKATYLHMKPALSPGSMVSPGQKVGNLIDLADNTHLHFEAYNKGGSTINPTGLLKAAYEKGGETLDGPHMALIGEKGKEFVIDADSTAAIEGTFPGFLAALNEAKYNDAIRVLRNFVSYEQPYAEPEVQYIEVPVEVHVPMPMGGGGLMMAGGGGIDNTYDTLEML